VARANSTLLRQPKELPSSAARDYRLLVEAVQADDLPTARKAYGRMMERLTSAGTGSDDALTRIGISLRRGDLATVRRTLDGLEGKALQVLRGLREHAELPPPDRGGKATLRKSH
jgi:Arc/MetJ family transcription regulator